MSLPTMFSSTITYPGVDQWNIDSAFAQLSGNNNDIIQLTSTSSYTDDFGNFHIIGEVNNTSTQPQTNIVVTAILSDTTNNNNPIVVGNYSAFSSIGTLRSGELSPFDIVIQNPQQILGKFNFMEFSTTSQPVTAEKPSTLVLNGSSSFVDNVGNLHITGNIVNQGQSPEQLLNIAATYYDNSSLGIVGTQSFGLNVANLASNQMTPFDITITDNKTKSQSAFYSLNMDSTQSSMSPPFNPKFSFDNGGGGTLTEQIFTGELFAPFPPLIPLVNNNQGSDDNDNDNSGSGDNGSGDDLNCEDIDERNFLVGNNDPNNFDGDNDGIGCEAEDLNNNGGDLDCADIRETNVTVGSNDPNNLDADGDGIGCEADDIDDNNGTRSGDLNCSDVGGTNIAVGSNDPNNLDADGDGIGCETNDETDTQTDNDENNDNENNIEDSNPCTAEEASRDYTCTSSSGDNDEIDDWTDPPVEEENNESSESDGTGENPTTDNQNDVNESENNDNDNDGIEEESNSEESDSNEDSDSDTESDSEGNEN
jgi:hypothetical protein